MQNSPADFLMGQIHPLSQLLPHMSQPWASSLRQRSRATGSPGTADGPSLARATGPGMLGHGSTGPTGSRAEGLPGAQAWASTGGLPLFNTGSCFPSVVSAWSLCGRARTAAPVPGSRPWAPALWGWGQDELLLKQSRDQHPPAAGRSGRDLSSQRARAAPTCRELMQLNSSGLTHPAPTWPQCGGGGTALCCSEIPK